MFLKVSDPDGGLITKDKEGRGQYHTKHVDCDDALNKVGVGHQSDTDSEHFKVGLLLPVDKRASSNTSENDRGGQIGN